MRILAFALPLAACLIGTPALAVERPEEEIMPQFAQANPAWSDILFHKHRTLGTKGCAVFSALVVAHQSGYLGDPFEFTRSLRSLDSFDDQGRLYWDRVTRFVPLIPERMHEEKDIAFDATQLELRSGNYVALQLRTPETREHWVAAIGLAEDDIEIIDPAGGWRGPFKKRYETAHITGFTVFRQMLVPMQLVAL